MRLFVVACLTVVYSVSAIACASSTTPDMRPYFAEGIRTGVDCMVSGALWNESVADTAARCNAAAHDLQAGR
jgi:hypothetical protein